MVCSLKVLHHSYSRPIMPGDNDREGDPGRRAFGLRCDRCGMPLRCRRKVLATRAGIHAYLRQQS